jgi:hypothetical protein
MKKHKIKIAAESDLNSGSSNTNSADDYMTDILTKNYEEELENFSKLSEKEKSQIKLLKYKKKS